jgi:tetratricopeptide (TPR) repeat protein
MAFNRRGFLQSATGMIAVSTGDKALAEEIDRAVYREPRFQRVQTAPVQQAMPVCCVLTPFGLKWDPSGRTIDFANVYGNMIVPAVREAGFELSLAQEQKSGERASRQIFDRLLQSDHMIVDVSDRNPDLSYELGIRHALRPSGTTVVCAEGAVRPFYDGATRIISYKLDRAGRLVDPQARVRELREQLRQARSNPQDDSPLFRLVSYSPKLEVDRARSDVFRAGVAYSDAIADRLRNAVRQGKAAVLQAAADPAFANLDDAGAGTVVELFLSLRSVSAFPEMVDLYRRMPSTLQRAPLIREQLAVAQQRTGELQNAIRTLQVALADNPNSEGYGLLGRIYKDLWTAAKAAGSPESVRFLRDAINAYYDGFQVDWRDAYPGINAVTLMEMEKSPDPRQRELLPVVRYAATQSVKEQPDYWDHATLLELAVLARDRAEASRKLSDALATSWEKWQLESTARNLALIRDVRRERGEDTDWIADIEERLIRANPGR